MHSTSVLNVCVVLFCIFAKTQIIRAKKEFNSLANTREFVNKQNDDDSYGDAANIRKGVVKRDASGNEGAVNGNVYAPMPPVETPLYPKVDDFANEGYHPPLTEADLGSAAVMRYYADSKREDAVNDVVNGDLDGGVMNQYPGLTYNNPIREADSRRGLDADLDEEMKKDLYYRNQPDYSRLPFSPDMKDFVKRDVGSALKDTSFYNQDRTRQGRQAIDSVEDHQQLRSNNKYSGFDDGGLTPLQYRSPRFSNNITTRVKNYPDQVIIVGQPMGPSLTSASGNKQSVVKRNDSSSLDLDTALGKNMKPMSGTEAAKLAGHGNLSASFAEIYNPEGSPDEAAAFHELLRKMYALEARVKMETADSDKAAQKVKDTQKHLEDLTNRIVVLRTDMRWAQLDAGEAGRRNMEEDSKGAVHNKALYELQQRMESLRSQLANTEMRRCRRKTDDSHGGPLTDPVLDGEYRKEAEALAGEEAAASLEGAAVSRAQQIAAVATRRVQEVMARVYTLRDQLESAQAEAVTAAQRAAEADTERRKKDDELAVSKQGLSELYHQRTLLAAASNARMKREVGEGIEKTRLEMDAVERTLAKSKLTPKREKRSCTTPGEGVEKTRLEMDAVERTLAESKLNPKRKKRSCKTPCTPPPFRTCNVCPDPPDPHPPCHLAKGEAQHRKVVQLRMFEESRVSAEKKEVAKAEQVAATAHKRLQEALAKVQLLKKEITRIQKEAERSAAGTKRAQACFEEHDQRKFEARRRVDYLYTQLTNVEIDECKKSKRLDKRTGMKSCDPCETKRIESPKTCEQIKMPKLAPCELQKRPKVCEPCDAIDSTTAKYNCILSQIFVAEAAVKLETAEAAKAEQQVILEHARLEAALNKLVALQSDVRNLQAQAQLIADNTKRAQAQLAYHDQLLHNAQKKVGCAVELQIDIEKYMAMHKKCKKELHEEEQE